MDIIGVDEGVLETYNKFLASTNKNEQAASNLVVAAQLARLELYIGEIKNQIQALTRASETRSHAELWSSKKDAARV